MALSCTVFDKSDHEKAATLITEVCVTQGH